MEAAQKRMLIPVTEAAKQLGVSRATVIGSLQSGRLRGIHLGSGRGHWYVAAESLRRLLEEPVEAAS